MVACGGDTYRARAGQTYDIEVTFTDGAMNDQITARSGLVILPNAADTPAQESGN